VTDGIITIWFNLEFCQLLSLLKQPNVQADLKMENRIERFNAPAKEYDALSINDSVMLVVGKGILNYEYIFHFLPNDKTQEKN
jgi:hypothetical protein